MTAPIPRRLLIHTATLERYAGTEKSNPVYLEPVTLSRIRIEPIRQRTSGSPGDQGADKLRMFIAGRNTEPAGMIPAVKDRITFEGEHYQVRRIATYFADRAAPHHFEVDLA